MNIVCTRENEMAINDTLNVLSGKWKRPIIGVLFSGRKRFKEIEQMLKGISPRMLSKELKDLEDNGIVVRREVDYLPSTCEYELTKSGESLPQVWEAMISWGIQHRKNVLGKK